MALLLDTHTLLWWLAEPERLSRTVMDLLVDPGQRVFVSAASAWEIATKHRPGRLPMADVLVQEGWPLLQALGFEPLQVTWRHGLRSGSDPLPHRDPFDRLLAAQEEADDITLVTADPAHGPFPCNRLWWCVGWPGCPPSGW